MTLIIVRPTLEYSRLLKAGGVLGPEDLVHVFSPVPCTGWGEGQFFEEKDDHDVEKDRQDGKLIALLNLSVFGFSFFVGP